MSRPRSMPRRSIRARRRPARRLLALLVGLATLSAAFLLGATPRAAAAPTPAAPADPATPVTIGNGAGLSVQVAEEFPQVISYDLDGHTMSGQAETLDTFTINGTDHRATTRVSVAGDHATYTSTFADLPGVTITSTLTATDQDTVRFAVTGISGDEADSVDELSIPHQSLVSVDSGDPAAQLARTKVATDSTTTADRFIAIDGDTDVDAEPVGTPYGFVTGSQLSAGIITNATEDSPQNSNTNWNTRLLSQIVDAGNGATRAELSVGTWTYAPRGVTDPRVRHYPLPTATVVLASDLNHDGTVTWQDGAIAYRRNMTHPLGSERVPERVVMRIPFNFASQATNPFTKTLDNTKRISLATDNLGQWVLEKGYANEGHDSGHPDYGNDFNARAGGLTDLNTLTRIGAQYNADIAVHVNATEAYPQAKDFTEAMVAGQPNGWNWLNQSYHIDQRRDLGSGAILDRFEQLHRQAPGVQGVYIDAYYSSGWLADALANQVQAMGLEVATEWAYKFEGSSIWSHWANDLNYGGANNKGINSTIIRFIANSDRDVWNIDPLLGGSEIKGFEGWTGHNDWNAFYHNIWTENLPTKFLQHYQLLRWEPGTSATLTGGVSVRMVDGARQIRMGDAVVLDGDTYLLPWQDDTDSSEVGSPSHADKMYFYSGDGGTTTFTLTDQFQHKINFTLYKLTDTGRVKVTDVRAHDGQVTLTGDKATPYVLAPSGDQPPTHGPAYGEGSGLVDPGFNAGDLDAWHPTGGAQIVRTGIGDNVAVLGSDASSISQQIKGLQAGQRYTVGVDVEIGPAARRQTTLRVSGQDGGRTVDAVNSFDLTPAKNRIKADAKRDTHAQRAYVSFVAPRNHKVTFSVSAVAGDVPVRLDDVRIMADGTVSVATPVSGASAQPSRPTGDQIANENFEGNRPGWGPFVKGDAGGTNDPRTSISDLHVPYSQKTWKNTYRPYDSGSLQGKAIDDVIDGNHSLKSHEENKGLVYRTVPARVPFVAGHSYTVSFRYQTNLPGQWEWVTGADKVSDGTVHSTVLKSEPMGPALDTATYERTFTAGCGDDWVGLRKVGGAKGTDFVIDDFVVTDNGPADGGAACATVAAPGSLLSPETANPYTTTFTNNEDTVATNVAMSVGSLPQGWTAQVSDPKGNLFAAVQPGETVSTTWLITPPDDAAGGTFALAASATYFHDCTTKSVSTQASIDVAVRATIPLGSITATADSENHTTGQAAGPVENVLDGDPSTKWHTEWNPTVSDYPHWVVLDLHGTDTVDGFGYQDRQDGNANGKVQDYTVSVSMDGQTWTQVAQGSFVDARDIQVVDFEATQARYVRFDALNALNGLPFASAAEMRVYGTASDVPSGYDPAPRPGDNGC